MTIADTKVLSTAFYASISVLRPLKVCLQHEAKLLGSPLKLLRHADSRSRPAGNSSILKSFSMCFS